MIKKIVFALVYSSLILGILEAAPRKKNEELPNWIFLNDSSIGSSWVGIGKTNYITVDLVYSFTVATYASTGGVRRTFGFDVEVPLYVSAFGNSNGVTRAEKITEAFGYGVVVPFTIGIEIKSFWLKGLFGYTFNQISEGFELTKNPDDVVKMNMLYHGFTYGFGLGWRYKNVINLSLKAMLGKLQNSSRNVSGAGFENEIEKRSRQYNLIRVGASASITF